MRKHLLPILPANSLKLSHLPIGNNAQIIQSPATLSASESQKERGPDKAGPTSKIPESSRGRRVPPSAQIVPGDRSEESLLLYSPQVEARQRLGLPAWRYSPSDLTPRSQPGTRFAREEAKRRREKTKKKRHGRQKRGTGTVCSREREKRPAVQEARQRRP